MLWLFYFQSNRGGSLQFDSFHDLIERFMKAGHDNWLQCALLHPIKRNTSRATYYEDPGKLCMPIYKQLQTPLKFSNR